MSSPARHERRRVLVPLLASLVALAVLGVGGVVLLKKVLGADDPTVDEVCTLSDGTSTVRLTLEQAHNAAIITGIAMADPDLGERAAHVAIATALQESGLRNLDYGDRDSLGLFQQRPSQGWGTEAQIRDPWYASKKFYSVLVKQKNWRTGDVNDVAQKVQRSGVPDGYRKHVEKAAAVAGVLSGRVKGGISCVDRQGSVVSPAQLAGELEKTYGVTATTSGRTVTVKASSEQLAWAMAHQAVASTRDLGTEAVRVGGQGWRLDGTKQQPWSATTGEPAGARTVVVTVR